jgi:hypothetical protein
MCQRLVARFCVAVLAVLGAVGAAPPGAPPVEHWRVVLVAGDTAQPVFDNAVRAVSLWLVEHGVAKADIHRLTASASGRDPAVEPATLQRVLNRVADLQAGPGEGCFVFVTSHGGHEGGFYLSRRDEMLQPAALARALSRGCGSAPTVVVVSSCFSGGFAHGAMDAPNRIILTAARADRPSFGCTTGRTYTNYDACLLGALPHAATWRGVFSDVKNCIEQRERQENDLPSHPQASFGAAVRNLSVQF